MAWQTDYCIMKEGMSILRGRKSVPGISSSERENGKKVLLRLHMNYMMLGIKCTRHSHCQERVPTARWDWSYMANEEDHALVADGETPTEFKLMANNENKNKQFFGHDKEDPHAYVRYFNKITSTLKFPNVPNTSIKLMLFPFSLEELHQLDTFYNALNSKDQDSLNSAAGGNFLDRMPRDCLGIIESKSKVRYTRNKPVVSKVSTTASTSSISPDVAELKDMVRALLLDKKGQSLAPV
nr:reverse transcriptase domain-containing protein [Tanacetum cinerariifolium]